MELAHSKIYGLLSQNSKLHIYITDLQCQNKVHNSLEKLMSIPVTKLVASEFSLLSIEIQR